EQLLSRYQGLWVIEESFRINKHTLEMRPIYHFKPRRVKAHILICYVAFALSRYVQALVKGFDETMSIGRIKEELSYAQTSLLRDEETGEEYGLPSQLSKEGLAIYKAVGAKRPRRPYKHC
ncbi:MAG: IS1634 family transposase, partial [Rhabdochlamydiaceae bacterium]